ncbi:MAG: hypothetical protein N2423_04905, partial [Novosphingobium sp.]|nr:hypothetical protein [Novosphingobium sp.]
LNATKGSFYWHFKDRADLLARMIDVWRARAIAELDNASVPDGKAAEALAALTDLPFTIDVRANPMQLALAMRLWAQRDERVAAVVFEVDQLRMAYFSRLYEAAGAPSLEARARATLLYAFMRTALMLVDPRDTALRDACRKLLVGPVVGSALA